MTTKPKFIHDCSQCIFLGSSVSDRNKNMSVDVYWCKSSTMPSMDSVLGRYGNKGHEYFSSHPPEAMAGPEEYLTIADKWYLFALIQATRKGLYKYDHKK